MSIDSSGLKRALIKAILLALLLIGLYVLYRASDYNRYLTREGFSSAVETIQSYVNSIGFLGPVAFIGISTAAIMAYVPAVVIIYFAVCIFGGIQGAFISAASIYLAVTAVYFTAQKLGRDFVARVLGRKLSRFESRLKGQGMMAVFYLRLFFFVVPPTNWLLGLSSLSFRDVFWGTVLGTIHHIIIFSWLTDVVVEVIHAGGSLNPLKTRELLAPIIVGTLMFVSVRLTSRLRERRREQSEIVLEMKEETQIAETNNKARIH